MKFLKDVKNIFGKIFTDPDPELNEDEVQSEEPKPKTQGEEPKTQGEEPKAQGEEPKAQSEAPASEKKDKDSFDTSFMDSDSLPVLRFRWNEYLVKILSEIPADDRKKLKNLSIYILGKNREYSWNDETFRKDLRQELEKKNLGQIGKDMISIQPVQEKAFERAGKKNVSDSQYKCQRGEIIIFGSESQTNDQKFHAGSAIEKRELVIKKFCEEFGGLASAGNELLDNLTVVIAKDEDETDMAQYAWVNGDFLKNLRHDLVEMGLDRIGSKSLQAVYKPMSEVRAEKCPCLIDGHVYYKWGKEEEKKEKKPENPEVKGGQQSGGKKKEDNPETPPSVRAMARLTIVEGSGSMEKPSYVLDSDKKKKYYLGRGTHNRKNDVVIKATEADDDLYRRNQHVSSQHAEIVYEDDNQFNLKASDGGVNSTDIVRDGDEIKLRDILVIVPLKHGDIIKLGKSVELKFTILNPDAQPESQDQPKPGGAMSVDESF